MKSLNRILLTSLITLPMLMAPSGWAQDQTQKAESKDTAYELIRKSLAYQRERAELLDKTYERVKEAVGATTAARFVQVEHQLLLIIDLQIASSLPVVEQGS